LAKPTLIVDDSPTIRRMVRVSLADVSPEGFVEAGSGLEAIEQLMLGPVGLLVLDLNMPDMHGLEVLSFVRKHPTYRTLPVVVLTTRGDDSSRQAALAAGATMYVTKPFVPQALAAQARAAIEGTRVNAQEHSRVEP
jgi:two-component system chemotaxis response regulator CheY